MENNITTAALAGMIGFLAAVWDKLCWMIILWAVVMVLDYFTGTLAALRNHAWDSEVAREGLWHKGGMIFVIGVAALFDLAVQTLVQNVGVELPFSTLILPIVLGWYIITELGSILENAIKMGAENVPKWLLKGLKITTVLLDKAGDKAVGEESLSPEAQEEHKRLRKKLFEDGDFE